MISPFLVNVIYLIYYEIWETQTILNVLNAFPIKQIYELIRDNIIRSSVLKTKNAVHWKYDAKLSGLSDTRCINVDWIAPYLKSDILLPWIVMEINSEYNLLENERDGLRKRYPFCLFIAQIFLAKFSKLKKNINDYLLKLQR